MPSGPRTEESPRSPSRRRGPSLSTLVLLAFGLGIATGIFFGESVAFLEPVGDAYIGLLQMTVLPYIVLSLLSGLGHMRPAMARRLARVGISVLLLVWAIGILAMLMMPLSYPDWESARFFSASLVEEREGLDLLALYIPRNPFAALAQAIVPATVVFCILLGLALMQVEKKSALMESIDALAAAVMRLTGMIVKTAPLGIFALAAAAAGTLRIDQFQAIQVYIWGYVAMWAVLVFVALPGVISALTGAKYWAVFRHTRDALITGFATGSLLVILPLLSKGVKELLRELGEESDESFAAVDVVMPIAYNLPSVSMLLTLSYVFFGGWFSGSPISVSQYPMFASLGLFTAFGGWTIAIPYLLQAFRVPSDLFQLYPLADVVTGRFSIVSAAIQTFTISLACGALLSGFQRVRRLRLLAVIGLTLVLGLTTVITAQVVLEWAIESEYTGDQAFVDRQLLASPVPVTSPEGRPPGLDSTSIGQDRLGVIQRRGSLRVGYEPERLPWAYRNSFGEMVGFDMEMAHRLARDLGVELVIVRVREADAPEWLASGSIDILMSGVAVLPRLSSQFAFSQPYGELTAAFVVPDHEQGRFSELETLQMLDSLTIGTPEEDLFVGLFTNLLPNAELVDYDTPRPYFRGEMKGVDALLVAAEGGSAWTLIYPQFAVAAPFGDSFQVPIAYALPDGNPRWENFVNSWLELSRRNSSIELFHRYWILGLDPVWRHEPRWSVIRDVLH